MSSHANMPCVFAGSQTTRFNPHVLPFLIDHETVDPRQLHQAQHAGPGYTFDSGGMRGMRSNAIQYAHDYGKYFWGSPDILVWLEANTQRAVKVDIP